VFVTGGRAVTEPYYSQSARSVCLSLGAFFIWFYLIQQEELNDRDCVNGILPHEEKTNHVPGT